MKAYIRKSENFPIEIEEDNEIEDEKEENNLIKGKSKYKNFLQSNDLKQIDDDLFNQKEYEKN